MAKQKKQKQLTPKQQMYQQIANYQVKQALGSMPQNNQQTGIQQLQAEYDKWNAVQNLQAEYNTWLKTQQPQQNTSKVSAPKVESIKFATAAERKAMNEKQTTKLPTGYNPEKSYANTYAKQRQEEAAKRKINQIPKLNDYVKALKEAESQKKENRSKINADKKYMDLYTEQSLTKKPEAKKTTRSNNKLALKYEDPKLALSVTGNNKVDALNMSTYKPSDKDNSFNELADKLVKSYKKKGILPFTYASKKWKNPYESLTDEEKATVRDYIQENKDNPNLSKKEKEILRAFTTIYKTAGNDDIDTSNVYNNTKSTLEKNLNALAGGFVGLNKPAIDAAAVPMVNVLDKTVVPGLVDALGGSEAFENRLTDENSDYNQIFAQAEKDNPTLYEMGRNAGQIYDYATLSALTGGVADKLGLKGAAATAFNQFAQAASDLGIDIVPEAQRMMQKEGKIDYGELAKRYGVDIIQNVAMEAVPALASSNTAYDYLAKTVGKNADIFKTMDASGAIKVAPDIVREATQIPNVDELDTFLAGVEKQRNDAINELERLSKQIPAVDAVDDIKLAENENIIPELVQNVSKSENIPTKPRPGGDMPMDPAIKAEANRLIAAEELENAAKTQQSKLNLPDDVSETMASDLMEIRDASDKMRIAAEATGSAKAIEKYNKLSDSIENYEKALYYSNDLAEVNQAKKATDAARQSLIREIKKVDPNYKGELTGTKIGNAEYRRTSMKAADEEAQALADSIIESENALNASKNVPGANPLQTFAEGASNEKWATSKARTNTFENQGWGADMPEKDFAYRVYSEAEQNADAIARNQTYQDLIYKDSFDAPDVKAAMTEIQAQLDSGNVNEANRLARKLAFEGREHGRGVQAFAEYNRNTVAGALQDAAKVQDDTVIQPWKARNKKKADGNSRIAKALADMGHKPTSKVAPTLTHDQIKKGVIAELNKEVGSVEKYFNNNDIEFLTQLAEDKSIPVWQITSEIEHKLNTGNWYTLDESIPLPQPTNRKLQNALNSLVTEQVRVEKPASTLQQITEEVRNTLAKESADFEGQFSSDDIDYLANLINQGATREELSDALNLKMATGSFGISDDTLQQVNGIFKEISQFDPNSKQFVEGQAEAYRLLANEIVPNATPMEKFEAWRYLAMLGNPKTMIRNFVGNQTFGAVTGISNSIAAVAEAGIDKGLKAMGGEGIQRTKSVLNPISDSALIKACAEDADASRYRQIIGSKYEKMDKNALRQSKSVFNSKLAQFYEKVTDAGISDYKAVKNKFSTSLAGYLKANGYDTNIFKAEDQLARLKNLSKTNVLSSAERAEMDNLSKQVQELEKARDYALKQAEYATFHEDNEVAKLLTKWSKDARNSDNVAANAMGLVIEGTVPFKKTPANILKSGIDYSPLGAIDSIRRTGKLVYENTGSRAGNLADVYKKTNLLGKEKEVSKELAADVIDSWSKTLTGTGLTALGFYLYDKGILHSSDPDTKYQDQLEGHQNYALEINGKSYTIDWAAPTIMPLMVGAELAKIWPTTGEDSENFFNNIDDYVAAANRLADPLVETSMLSGIKDTLETAASAAQYNENLNIPALLAYNTITGYATQGVPTLSGQIARTIDPTRRSTYTDKEGVAGILDKQLKKQMNKIPGLSTLNQPYVDTYGRQQQNSPFNNPVGNLAYQMLSPGYLSNINETDADRVSREAYGVSGDTKALPQWKSYFKANGERVSPEQYTAAATEYGKAQYDIRNAFANDEWFNSLEGAQKEDIINDLNTLSEHVAKASLDPEYSTTSKPYNAYKEGGIDGLLAYYKTQTDKSIAKELLGDSGVRTNSNAGKAVVEAVSNGNMEEAKKLANQAAADKATGKTTTSKTSTSSAASKSTSTEDKAKAVFKSDFGDNGSRVYKQYQAAKSIDPTTSSATYRNTYKRIDSLGDSNGSVNQKEFIQYLNNGNYTEAEAQKMASMYGSWTKIPKLENGTWKFKKK